MLLNIQLSGLGHGCNARQIRQLKNNSSICVKPALIYFVATTSGALFEGLLSLLMVFAVDPPHANGTSEPSLLPRRGGWIMKIA
jgi:hypothetical protein